MALSGDKVELIAKLRREGRAKKATDFRLDYKYGPDFEGRTCIWPSGVYSWSEKSSGIMWIGVHGKNSVCVVTKASDLDVTRVHNCLIFHTKEDVLQYFRRAVISELEAHSVDLANRYSKLSEMLDPTINLPFGVVSVSPVNPDDDKVYRIRKESVYKTFDDNDMNRYWELLLKDMNIGQASIDEQGKGNDKHDQVFLNILKSEKIRMQNPVFCIPVSGYDETKTIYHLQKTAEIQAPTQLYGDDAKRFLLGKIMEREVWSIDETIQIAISAFQRLFKKDFSAAELGVSVMDPKYFVRCEDEYFKDAYVKHLEQGEINQHLAAIKLSEKGDIEQHLDQACNADDLPPNKRKRV